MKPFVDSKDFEFLGQKNDVNLFCLGTHSKKRPHGLTFARLFDYQVLDMIELGVQEYTPMSSFKVPKPPIGFRPLIVFRGEHWESNDHLATVKSMLLDIYTGDASSDKIDLNNGIKHVMVFTLVGGGNRASDSDPARILLNVYNLHLKKQSEAEANPTLPKVELQETGPYVEFITRRFVLGNADMIRESLRVPSLNKTKKKKNIERDSLGEKVGRVWMDRQDLAGLQTRKMKGLKKGREVLDEEQDRMQE